MVFGGGESIRGSFAQIFAGFACTLNAVSDGMQYGWTAPVIPILQSEDTPVPIQKSDIVWLENIFMIGGFAGLPITILLVDKIGRKNSILLACLNNVIAWILIAVASSVELLYVGRFLSGLASDVAFISAPMYIAEIADPKIRGFLGSFVYVQMLVGVVIVYSVAPFVTIVASSIVGAAILVFQLLTYSFMPKSPYYLLLKGRKEEARKSLQFLRSTEDVDKELQEISVAVERQGAEKGRVIDLFTVKSNRKALVIVSVLSGNQHFSGISVFFMNIHAILGEAALSFSSNATAILFAVIMLVAACTAACFMDRAGRKILLSTSSFLTGLSLLVLASYFAIKNSGADTSSYNWVPVAAVMFYAAAFKYGLGLVPIVIDGELFPTNVKAWGMTMGDISYVIFSVISIHLYQFLLDNFGIHVPMFIFSACCFLATLFVVFYIPETKGKTLEEIQLMLKGQKLVSKSNGHKSDLEGKVNDGLEDTVL